jgi:hypothetical protein
MFNNEDFWCAFFFDFLWFFFIFCVHFLHFVCVYVGQAGLTRQERGDPCNLFKPQHFALNNQTSSSQEEELSLN